jgi:small subunit ribosomal protein S14
MARTALEVKTARAWKHAEACRANGTKVPFPTKLYHRCPFCGRSHGYINKFNMCRICLREKARCGEIIGLRKASW